MRLETFQAGSWVGSPGSPGVTALTTSSRLAGPATRMSQTWPGTVAVPGLPVMVGSATGVLLDPSGDAGRVEPRDEGGQRVGGQGVALAHPGQTGRRDADGGADVPEGAAADLAGDLHGLDEAGPVD